MMARISRQNMPVYKTFPVITDRGEFQKPLLPRALYHFRWLLAAFLKHKWFIFRRVLKALSRKKPQFTDREKPKCVILNRTSVGGILKSYVAHNASRVKYREVDFEINCRRQDQNAG